ncbi:MAG: hypothetical protein ACJ72U_17125 [Nitrososphaeraceae archaeon]
MTDDNCKHDLELKRLASKEPGVQKTKWRCKVCNREGVSITDEKKENAIIEVNLTLKMVQHKYHEAKLASNILHLKSL